MGSRKVAAIHSMVLNCVKWWGAGEGDVESGRGHAAAARPGAGVRRSEDGPGGLDGLDAGHQRAFPGTVNFRTGARPPSPVHILFWFRLRLRRKGSLAWSAGGSVWPCPSPQWGQSAGPGGHALPRPVLPPLLHLSWGLCGPKIPWEDAPRSACRRSQVSFLFTSLSSEV